MVCGLFCNFEGKVGEGYVCGEAVGGKAGIIERELEWI